VTPRLAFERFRSALPGWRWPFTVALAGIAAFAVAVAILFAALDWNAARGRVEGARCASAATSTSGCDGLRR
jgi:hypothetical protein